MIDSYIKKYIVKDHDCIFRILHESIMGASEKGRLGRNIIKPTSFGFWEIETERDAAHRETLVYLFPEGSLNGEGAKYILYLPDSLKEEPRVEQHNEN